MEALETVQFHYFRQTDNVCMLLCVCVCSLIRFIQRMLFFCFVCRVFLYSLASLELKAVSQPAVWFTPINPGIMSHHVASNTCARLQSSCSPLCLLENLLGVVSFLASLPVQATLSCEHFRQSSLSSWSLSVMLQLPLQNIRMSALSAHLTCSCCCGRTDFFYYIF